MRKRDYYAIVITISAAIAAFSVFVAVLASDACGGDGSFDPADPAARPSAFCQDMHFPGIPDSGSSWALFGAFFLTPALVALAFGLLGVATGRRRLRLAGAYLGLVLVAGVAVFTAFNAEIGFAGY